MHKILRSLPIKKVPFLVPGNVHFILDPRKSNLAHSTSSCSGSVHTVCVQQACNRATLSLPGDGLGEEQSMKAGCFDAYWSFRTTTLWNLMVYPYEIPCSVLALGTQCVICGITQPWKAGKSYWAYFLTVCLQSSRAKRDPECLHRVSRSKNVSSGRDHRAHLIGFHVSQMRIRGS